MLATEMKIEFKRLSEVAQSAIIELMNNQLVRRQMPLMPDTFNENDCERFVTAKEELWTEHGYGPWAFVIDDQFGGWGGLQPENGEADLAIVLHPNYWGAGKEIYTEIVRRAFGDMGLETLTALLPPTRKKIKGLFKLGLQEDGALRVGGKCFLRYRLQKS